MKTRFSKLAAALAFAATLAVATNSYATTKINFNAAGATVLYNTFALAAVSSSSCGPNIWTFKKGASGIDGRSSSIPAETGNIWIAWNTSGANVTTVCAYLALDATVGAQLYFAVPRATLSIPSTAIGANGQNLVPTLTDTALPQAVYTAINAQPFNAGILDSRPEDALFSETRALAALEESGSLVGFTSGAYAGSIAQANYSAAKGGIVSLTRSAAAGLHRYGVRANCIAPVARTRMSANVPVELADMGDPEDVAPMVVYLLSDASSHVTGQVYTAVGSRIAVWNQPVEVREMKTEGRWTPEQIASRFDSEIGQEKMGLIERAEAYRKAAASGEKPNA